MERSNDHSNLAATLAEARPTPHEDFAKELDERVAAGFPRRTRLSGSPLGRILDRLSGITPRRLLFAGSGAVLATIAIAIVIVAGAGSGQPQPAVEQTRSNGILSEVSPFSDSDESEPQSGAPQAAGAAGAITHSPDAGAAGGGSESALPSSNLSSRHRDIERSAEIALLADPDDVADDSAAVFATVHEARGIVLHSTTVAGKRAGANFDLLIPSARLGDALAAFSAIDEVRARHEATDDITAPTISTSEELRDSRAKIDSLLTQLAGAETEAEMATIEAELAGERRHAAQLRAQLKKLEQRTDFSRVSVKIETGDASTDSSGAWGIGDAFGETGHILGIAAGVTLVGLAILAPILLFLLLAWLAHRTWVRAQRKRALDNP